MESGQMKESDICNSIGWVIIALGSLAGILYIINFGQIEIESIYYTKKVWSGVMVCVGIGIILNSLLVGYLFQKIGSLLAYQEAKAP